jgi:hypothetical protein
VHARRPSGRRSGRNEVPAEVETGPELRGPHFFPWTWIALLPSDGAVKTTAAAYALDRRTLAAVVEVTAQDRHLQDLSG